jgi:hypothetical protein
MGNILSRLPLMARCCSGGNEIASNAMPLISMRPSPMESLLERAKLIRSLREQQGAGPFCEDMCCALHELHDWAESELVAMAQDGSAGLERIGPQSGVLLERGHEALNNQQQFDALGYYFGAYLDGTKEEALRGILDVTRAVLQQESLRSGSASPVSPTARHIETEMRRTVESFFADPC